MDISLQDAITLEKVIDPNEPEYRALMEKLLKPQDDGKTRRDRLNNPSEFRYVLPYKGDPDLETIITSTTSLAFSDKAAYRNGVASLATTAAELIDLIVTVSGRKRMNASLVVSAEAQSLYDTLYTSGSSSTLVYYCERVNLAQECLSLSDKLDTMIVDHTTVNIPIDDLLNFAYKAGVRIVDGVFPYHTAAVKGWDVVAGLGKWSYTHSKGHISIGPDDDSTRLLKYTTSQYNKFIDPKLWEGKSKQYVYEIRKCVNGLATYRAVFVGDSMRQAPEEISFKLPMCSSEDMVLVTINRELAAGVFVSRSNNARELAELHKDYAIEVRKDLFNGAVNYLISRQKGVDIVGDAIRYVYQHNYVDLMEGVRVVRCQALSYADALCVAMVCALVAFELRYNLTSKSVPAIRRNQKVAALIQSAPLGAFGRLAWIFSTYIADAVGEIVKNSRDKALQMLMGAEYIPGVCYDVYLDTYYQPEADWYEAHNLALKEPDNTAAPDDEEDPFFSFLGDNVAAYNPTVLSEKTEAFPGDFASFEPYIPNIVPDPESVVQNAYDVAFPGNSTAQLQNVAELRRVRDVNINTEFYGKIEVAKDIAAPELLHDDAPIRTATLPVSRTPLLDAIMASAKRNFNPPDLQMQSDVFEFSKALVDEFIDNCFVKGYKDTIQKSYMENPISFNVTDYIEWRATRDDSYRSALESECPNDMVELELERYDTIIKKRVKPKLSTMAQHELAQPQVIVSMSKKDTAPFTSVFRKIFERFDNALKPQFKSAGRSSDFEISKWLTEFCVQLSSLKAIEIDSGKYDKSQNLLARLIEAYMCIALGMDPGVLEIFADSYVGKVSSKVLGLVFISAYQMKSGAAHTMLGNIIYNCISAGRSVGYTHIRFSISKGDDNVLWVDDTVNGKLAVSKMANLFNLEVKYIENSVIYFSSGYVLFTGSGYGFFAPDPLKMAELLGEMGGNAEMVKERFISFGDRVKSLTLHHYIPPLLQQHVRLRHAVPDIPVVDLVDAFCAIAGNLSVYSRIVAP